MQRLTEMVQQGQSGGNAVTTKRVTQSYNALNQRTSTARFQSTGTTNAVATTDYTYDTINRLSTLTHKQGSTTLTGYNYAYDGLSRLTSVNSTVEGISTYSYDSTSQVTGADHSTQTDETYGYDANGNRNTSGYTIASNNRTTAGQGFRYTYDDEGNRLTRTETSTGKVQSYDWDYRNRLISVKDRNTSGGSIDKQVNYEYDAINRMVRRELDADGAGSGAATNQYWIYDEGINAILQFEGAAASTLSHRYLWSNQVDELFADEQVTSLSTGGNTLWGLADHLGSLRDIADMNESTGVTTVTNHRTFSVTGKLISETNAAVDMLFAFTGKQLDEVTGLQHNLNRWYDPGLGQWISEDPIGFEAGDENIRRYVGGEYLLKVDPSGLIDTLVPSHLIPKPRSWIFDYLQPDASDFLNPVGVVTRPLNRPLRAIVAQVLGRRIEVVFGHGGRHLKGTGLSQIDVERAITEEIRSTTVQDTKIVGEFWGRITEGGRTIEYHAYPLPDGKINVGTYYPE